MLYAALLLSGFAVLLFELLWTRLGTVILGTTTYSVTAVVATLMGGLSVGGFLSGKILRTVRNPALAYAGTEFCGLGIALTFAHVSWSWMTPNDIGVLPFLLWMGAATTLFGMSLPFAVAALSRAGNSSDGASFAYGVNTAGGAIGSLMGAFIFVPRFGLLMSARIGAVILFAAVAIALMAARRSGTSERGDQPEELGLNWKALTLAFWCGTASLAVELVWTRLLSLILGPSVYALGIVFFVYLLGIAAGALWARSLIRKGKLGISIALVQLFLGFSTAWSLFSFGVLPYLFVALASSFHPRPDQLRVIEFFLSAIPIIPPAVFHGMILPMLIAQATPKDQSSEGVATGYIISANTVGAIVGIGLAGLFAIPYFGFLPILIVVLIVHVAIALKLLHSVWFSTRKAFFLFASAVSIFVTLVTFNAGEFWDRSVLASGVYKYAVGDALGGKDPKIEVGKVLYYREGISSTVAVIQTSNDRVLSVDGKADASAYGDRSTQVLLAALPLSLSAKTGDVLVIGFASGVTAGVSSLFPETRVVAVDIEPAVYEASDYFREINHGPLSSPHEIIVGDGRHYLKEVDRKFDVITSEPSNPWMSGVAPLFTREFFQLAKGRLSDGGVMCQWLPIYGMSKVVVASILKTFQEVFPQVLVFESVENYDLLLIGSTTRISLDPRRFEHRWKNEALKKELGLIHISSGWDLIGKFLMGEEGVASVSSGAVINTDQNGYVEYRAPLSLHLRTASSNSHWLSEATEGITPYLWNNVSHREKNELSVRFRERGEERLTALLK
jgi:spermidine synthase